MNIDTGAQIIRAGIFHTPRNPFHSADALEHLLDGALCIQNGRILACGQYYVVRAAFPSAGISDRRDGFILPGFIDIHTHFPQVRIAGELGDSLLEWLERIALPEEAKLSDVEYSRTLAHEFVRALISHGTTTALVFGSHFASATAALFHAAERAGLRLTSGLVLSDRNLRPELLQTPDTAYRESRSLVDRFHGRGRLNYAVIPRFALSASEPMLDVCRALLYEDASLSFTTHINENAREIDQVLRVFPRADDYLSIYEQFGLIGRRSVLAHNVHVSDPELRRLARYEASIAHCPSSNAALGSGIFPMRRHLDARVRFAMGTDVGAGAGFSVLKETLQAYLMQRVAPDPMSLSPAQMLYLATRAGAEALGLEDRLGDFVNGKAADFVYLCPPHGGTLEAALQGREHPERILAAILTLAGAESVREVQVAGEVIFSALHAPSPLYN